MTRLIFGEITNFYYTNGNFKNPNQLSKINEWFMQYGEADYQI